MGSENVFEDAQEETQEEITNGTGENDETLLEGGFQERYNNARTAEEKRGVITEYNEAILAKVKDNEGYNPFKGKNTISGKMIITERGLVPAVNVPDNFPDVGKPVVQTEPVKRGRNKSDEEKPDPKKPKEGEGNDGLGQRRTATPARVTKKENVVTAEIALAKGEKAKPRFRLREMDQAKLKRYEVTKETVDLIMSR